MGSLEAFQQDSSNGIKNHHHTVIISRDRDMIKNVILTQKLENGGLGPRPPKFEKIENFSNDHDWLNKLLLTSPQPPSYHNYWSSYDEKRNLTI